MGTHINLLDWRAERRARRLQEFKLQMGAGALAGIALAALWWFHASGVLSAQEARNKLLQQEISRLDAEIREIADLETVQDNLLARMQVIESLQASRSATVHFFDELVNTVPDGVYLTVLRQQGERVTIEGIAESNARVSTYMKNLDASDWFADPRLVVIRTTERNRVRQSEFTLQVRGLRQPASSADADGAQGGDRAGR